MEYSDYASRNATECKLSSCQICKYLIDLVFTANNAVGNLKNKDIEKRGHCYAIYPPNAWRQAQSQDKTLQCSLH